MRKISLIVIHCSATRVDRDFTAKDVDTAHRYRGLLYMQVGRSGTDAG